MLDFVSGIFNFSCINQYANCVLRESNKSYLDAIKNCFSKENDTCNATDYVSDAVRIGLVVGIVAIIGKLAKDLMPIKPEGQKRELFTNNPRVIKSYHSEKLEQGYKELYPLLRKFRRKISNASTSDIWRNEKFISFFSDYMEKSYQLTELLCEELKRVSSEKPLQKHSQQELMTELLIHQWKDEKQPIFLYAFMAFAHYYKWARRCVYINEDGYLKCGMTKEDQARYFEVGTPQYQWRQLLNQFVKNFAALGITDLVNKRDDRITIFACEDTKEIPIRPNWLWPIPLTSYHGHLANSKN